MRCCRNVCCSLHQRAHAKSNSNLPRHATSDFRRHHLESECEDVYDQNFASHRRLNAIYLAYSSGTSYPVPNYRSLPALRPGAGNVCSRHKALFKTKTAKLHHLAWLQHQQCLLLQGGTQACESLLSSGSCSRSSPWTLKRYFITRVQSRLQTDRPQAIWEMTHLIIAPKKVFRSIYYHKRMYRVYQFLSITDCRRNQKLISSSGSSFHIVRTAPSSEIKQSFF